MSWNNNGGGKGNNPWGSAGGPRRPAGDQPNVEEIFKRGQERLRGMLPGGKGTNWAIGAIAFIIWIATGFYMVDNNEQGVVLRFGEYAYTSEAGPHLRLPWPIESDEVKGITDENTVQVGSRTSIDRQGRQSYREILDESLMLTGDENIVDIKFNVVWNIQNLQDYLFNLSEPEGTIKAVSESVMRELVGKNAITSIITTARESIQDNAKSKIQNTLDEYRTGVRILRVQIIETEAPDQVKDSFLDVQRAEADQKTTIENAEAYSNKVIPEARGASEKLIQEAQAYAAVTVAGAEGKADRFLSVYAEYIKAKDVTKTRIYLETMEEILAGMDKTIVDTSGGSGVIPYLSIDELKKKKGAGQ